MLLDGQPGPEQVAILHRMTSERRFALAEGLSWTAREMKKAWLRAQHPDWTDDQIAREVN
jgi:hypothetical protein